MPNTFKEYINHMHNGQSVDLETIKSSISSLRHLEYYAEKYKELKLSASIREGINAIFREFVTENIKGNRTYLSDCLAYPYMHVILTDDIIMEINKVSIKNTTIDVYQLVEMCRCNNSEPTFLRIENVDIVISTIDEVTYILEHIDVVCREFSVQCTISVDRMELVGTIFNAIINNAWDDKIDWNSFWGIADIWAHDLVIKQPEIFDTILKENSHCMQGFLRQKLTNPNFSLPLMVEV